jgi:alpha-glucosidase
LTLPGTAFVYQGDEIGMANGPGADPPFDRAGRDPMRHPMQWDASSTGGFTSGVPWLPLVDPAETNVEAQRADPDSLVHHYRGLIGRRKGLGTFRLLDADSDTLAYERGRELISIEVKRG